MIQRNFMGQKAGNIHFCYYKNSVFNLNLCRSITGRLMTCSCFSGALFVFELFNATWLEPLNHFTLHVFMYPVLTVSRKTSSIFNSSRVFFQFFPTSYSLPQKLN